MIMLGLEIMLMAVKAFHKCNGKYFLAAQICLKNVNFLHQTTQASLQQRLRTHSRSKAPASMDTHTVMPSHVLLY